MGGSEFTKEAKREARKRKLAALEAAAAESDDELGLPPLTAAGAVPSSSTGSTASQQPPLSPSLTRPPGPAKPPSNRRAPRPKAVIAAEKRADLMKLFDLTRLVQLDPLSAEQSPVRHIATRR